MELKDLILETIHELSLPSFPSESQTPSIALADTYHTQELPQQPPLHTHTSTEALKEECEFLEGLQERLLVLFEGLKAPHNQNIESCLHITTHFLQHQLNVIQERLEALRR